MTRRRYRQITLLAAIALIGLALSWRSSPPPNQRPARGLLSVPTNMLTALSPSVCNSTNLILATGAVVDSTMTHGDSSSCGSIKLPTATSCPISGDPLTTAQAGLATSFVYPNGPIKGECGVGGSLVRTYQVPVSGSTRYTFSAYMKSAGTYPGDVYVDIQAFNSSGTLIGDVLLDSWANSKTSDGADKTVGWEETLGWFQTQPSAATLYIQMTRYMASTPPIDNVWIDDLYLGPGFVHREESPVITKTFPGTTTALDALGNFTVKRINGPTAGQMEPFFPKCISVRTSVHTLQWYADRGWNCIWGANLNDSLSTAPWTSSSNLLVGGRAAVSSSVPDGMRVLMDVDEAVRGSFAFEYTRSDTGAVCLSTDPPPCTAHSAHLWNAGIKDNMVNAMGTIVTRGYADTLLGILNDAEDKTSRRQRDRAVMALVDSTDRANNGGQRRWPIVTNAGNPSISRSYTKADGTSYIDITGTYSARKGPFEKMRHEQGQQAPVGYCQLQTGGLNLRQMLYRCLGEGGKMFALWSDSSNTNLALGSQVGVNLEYEPSYNDFPFMWGEVDQLMPLIRQPLPTDWSVSSSNTAVDVYARSYAGKAYVFVVNTSGIAQSTTLTFTGAGPVSSLVQYGWATGTPDTGATTVGTGLTLTVPASGAASGIGNGGGTLVLRAVGSSVASAGATTTTATPTTAPATTTTAAPSTSSFDDPSATYLPTSSSESSGWVQYGPSLSAAVGDYLLGNHVTSLAGATATKTFTGSAISLYGATGPYDGRFTVSIDGAPPSNAGCANPVIGTNQCEAYSATDVRQTLLWQSGVLVSGAHTITVTVTGSRASASAGNFIVLDRFDVSTAPGATTTTTSSTTTTAPSVVSEHLYSTSLPTPGAFVASGLAATLGVRINVSCAGTIPGVWWYRSTADTGTISVGIWSASGTLLGSGSGSPAAGPGWRYVALSTPVSVTSGQTVIAGRHSPSGAYGYAYNGFTSRSVVSPSGCLTAPASVAGSNGVYDLNASLTFPSSNYLDSEYFVSPAFESTPTTTTAPPSRVVTIDAFVDTNRNGVLNSGEARMVRTKWRVVNSSGAVIASGSIVRSVTVSVPGGTGYAVKFFPPLRATSPVTVAIPSSGAVTIRVGGCCPTVFNRRS